MFILLKHLNELLAALNFTTPNTKKIMFDGYTHLVTAVPFNVHELGTPHLCRQIFKRMCSILVNCFNSVKLFDFIIIDNAHCYSFICCSYVTLYREVNTVSNKFIFVC